MNQNNAPKPGADDQSPAGDVRHQLAVRIAAVAGIFSLVICALLFYYYSLRWAKDPHEAASFKAAKLALDEQPEDQELVQSVRAVDLQLRKEYFRQRALADRGALLLLGGVVVFLVAAKSAATLRRKLPAPKPQAAPQDLETQQTRTARWSVAALGVVLIGAAVCLILTLPSDLPGDGKELAAVLAPGPSDGQNGPKARVVPPPPSQEEIDKMWPYFRGPHGSGVSAYTNVPESWDDVSGKNILWKTPVPLPGMNSPVVWADRVFLSGATKDRREVYCFDTKTGKIIWRKKVPPHPQASRMREPDFSGYAAPTVATDGRFVFAVFIDGELAAFDLSGKMVWRKSLGIPENSYGHSSSLTTYRDFVLVQMDQGTAKKPKSKLYAFQAATGQKAWEVSRPVAVSWTSPIVISHDGRDQLITCADPWLIAYNPADGKELWRADCGFGEAGPSPVFNAGTVYVGNAFCQLGFSAVRADGSGDVTKTHIDWSGPDGLPETASPLATDEYVFLAESGTLTCYDAKEGTVLWEEYEVFDYASFWSSPSLVGNRIYLLGELDKEDEEDEEGNPVTYCKCWVLEYGREEGSCKVVAEGRLDEGCVSSPAFQDGRIYVRGKKHLF
ncbi:MAG: PQQ-binding-like beta-propeller repeat protein, partial [Planctomycetota bacterium]